MCWVMSDYKGLTFYTVFTFVVVVRKCWIQDLWVCLWSISVFIWNDSWQHDVCVKCFYSQLVQKSLRDEMCVCDAINLSSLINAGSTQNFTYKCMKIEDTRLSCCVNIDCHLDSCPFDTKCDIYLAPIVGVV